MALFLIRYATTMAAVQVSKASGIVSKCPFSGFVAQARCFYLVKSLVNGWWQKRLCSNRFY